MINKKYRHDYRIIGYVGKAFILQRRPASIIDKIICRFRWENVLSHHSDEILDKIMSNLIISQMDLYELTVLKSYKL